MLPWNFRLVYKLTLVTVLLILFLYPISGSLQESPVYLTPPGLRSVKDPSIVIPTSRQYLNQPPTKPAYRDAAGKPAKGWVAKYINTRRFSSDRSAWIYYLISDLTESETIRSSWSLLPFRIWPGGTTIVLESYQGDSVSTNNGRLMEVVVMHKINNTESASAKSFYSANWSYARFTPEGALSITPEKVVECHQCHSIAFHVMGDLVFTQFP